MGKIYQAQTKLRIQLTVGQDITSATCLIKYKKPSGVTGSWSASIGTASTGVIYYDVASADIIDEAGEWSLWAYITFSDTKVAAGEPCVMNVYSQGK